jgi:His/Glu/Gln/Arg/opine family amino acid ABC transporter permease subunit
MSSQRQYSETDFFVAPRESPPSRRPPITIVGPLGWMRENLFSSRINTLATLVTAAILLWFLWAFLTWSIRSAQWSVVYNNLRLIAAGLYDREETWRLELTAGILVFLTGLGLGVWSRVARSVFIAVAVTLVIILAVPILGSRIPEPTIYVLIEPRKAPSNFVFTGLEDQKVTVTIDPLTDVADTETSLLGYVESQSRAEWSTQARAARNGELDLSAYNLVGTVRLLDKSGAVMTLDGQLAEFTFSGTDSARATFTLPADDWYVVQVERDDTANGERDNNQGYAWLKINGVELFSSQEGPTADRELEFGAPPKVEHPLFAEEKAYRFEGAQSLGEFISLQVAPFFERIALPLVVGSVLFFNGWALGVLGKHDTTVRRSALFGWVLAFPVILLILQGVEGWRGLPLVPMATWGGLLLTMLLTFVGIAASFPLGVALALGRRSDLPVIKWTCTLLIETIRGVPLITILFMAKLIVPFFWSALSDIDLVIRMMIGLTLFSAAYLAENVRGGLQIIPHGQIEAARALGLNPLLMTTFIVLPQALRAVIPAIVGQFISLFKDTSLVAVVGLFELVGIVDTIVSGQPIYRPYQREAYIFIAIVYFIISYAMSDVSRRLEESGAGSLRKAGI